MATVTQSQFDQAWLRRSQEDHKLILEALAADGSIEIVDDPEPEEPKAVEDEEGNPVLDAEGNEVLEAPEGPPVTEAILIEVDNVPEEEEAEEPVEA